MIGESRFVPVSIAEGDIGWTEFKCDKCGKWSRLEGLAVQYQSTGVYRDHLDLHCPVCGFDWHMPCKDYYTRGQKL